MNDIIKALDEAELFLRNRTMDGMSLELNEYDIGILRDISQVCARAYDEINRQKAEIVKYKEECSKCGEKTTKTILNLQELLGEQRAEIERLKAEVKFSDYLEYEATNQIKAEAIKEFADKMHTEIHQALESNYKARAERIEKYNIGETDEFISYCEGKIAALRGIDDFVDSTTKETVGDV